MPEEINNNVTNPNDIERPIEEQPIGDEIPLPDVTPSSFIDEVLSREIATIYRRGNIAFQTIRGMPMFNNEPMSEKEEKKEILDTNRLVETVGGKKYPASECVYYDSRYFHKSHKDVVKCELSGIYNLKHKMYSCTKSITIKEDNKVSFENCYVSNHLSNRLYPCYSNKYGFDCKLLSLENITGWKYAENYYRGIITDNDDPELAVRIHDITRYDTFKNHFSDIKLDVKTMIKIGKISPSFITTEGLKYTFGVELEMSRGFLPYWKAAQNYNVLCIRDGSVDGGSGNGGPEIVTGVMTGDTGVNHLQEICLELSKRTEVNHTCGMHLHIGNIDFTQKFLVNAYRLALFLEDEILSTLPASRRDNRYCRRLKVFTFKPAICDTLENQMETEEAYNKLFRWVSVEKASNPNFEYNKDKQHPLGPKCGYTHSTPRYCWLNLVPAMFNTRGCVTSKTIEIRNHSGTTNFVKVRNWLLFFMAFMAFVEQHPELIDSNITMDDVIKKMLPRKAKSLIMYFNSRKELFSKNSNEKDEYIQSSEEKKKIKELINE